MNSLVIASGCGKQQEFQLEAFFSKKKKKSATPTPPHSPLPAKAHLSPQSELVPLIPSVLSLFASTNACKPLWTCSPRPGGIGALSDSHCVLALEKT